jgi:hypothetical protein
VIGWLKDLDGRYVYVNRGYVEQLEAAAERILGHLDAELPPREAIDGPRIQEGDALEDEPVQLEYRVAAYEGRPALAVLRFPVRDIDGKPVCVCGVAAPIEQAQLARAECSQLMLLETGESTVAGDAELAHQRRRVAALHEASSTAAKRGHELAFELAEERERREQLGVELAQMRELLSEERTRANELEDALKRERGRAEEAKLEGVRQCARAEQAEAALRGARDREAAAVQEQQARTQSAEADAAAARAAADRVEAELAEAAEIRQRLESERESMAAGLEQARLYALQAQACASAAPVPEAAAPQAPQGLQALQGLQVPAGRPCWSGRAQRALSAALAQASEWRIGIRDAVKVIGSEGGWDVASVWLPDDRRPLLKCAAMWTADPDRRAEFETRTWQRPHSRTRTELGTAFATGEAAWLTGIEKSEDERLLMAAREGMNTALIVPVCDGGSAVAVLELLSCPAAPPDEDVAASIAAVALQLGHFWHLLRAGAEPHWHVGRF